MAINWAAPRMLFLLLMCGCLAWVLFRWWNEGRRAPILTALLGTVLVVVGFLEARWVHTESRFTSATQQLLDRDDARVDCERFSQALFNARNADGWVHGTPTGELPQVSNLRWETCRDLASWLHGTKNAPTIEQIRAVHVLTHEAVHLTGDFNEASTECKAMQRDAAMAALLGATPAQGEALASDYWRSQYPHMRDEYRSGDCVSGGGMDEHPATPAWPTG